MAANCPCGRSRLGIAVFVALNGLIACSDDGAGTGEPADGTAPIVTLTSSTNSDGVDYTLTGTVSDDIGVVALTYRVNEGDVVALVVSLSFRAEVTLQEGSNALHVEATDAAGNIGSAALTVLVSLNAAPVAASAEVSLDEDTPTAIALAGHDPNGDSLTFAVVDEPVWGSLTGSPPNVTYTPDDDYAGGDSFSFRANDGAFDSNLATVTLQITAVNDGPVADEAQAITDEDTSVDIALAASDIEDDPLVFRLVEPPAYGQVDFSGAPTITYTPDADYAGPDSFTFAVNDGELDSDEARVDLTVSPVNDGPVAFDASIETREDAPVTFDLTATDVDTPADALTLNVLAQPAAEAGTLDATAAPTVTFIPASNYSGSTSFTFEVDDGAATDTATVTLTVLEGSVLYVEVAGSNSNGGYSAEQPLRTLGAALTRADRVADGDVPDTIRLGPGRYCEPTGVVRVDRNVIIVGAGMDETVLDGSSLVLDCPDPHADGYVGCDERRVLTWPDEGVVEVFREHDLLDPEPIEASLSDLAITNGLSEEGGGLRNFEALALERVRVADNCADGGGGIYNAEPELAIGVDGSPWARLTVVGGVVENNRATYAGGGLYNADGRVSLTDTQVVGNEVRLGDDELSRFADGGGIYSQADASAVLTITDSVVSQNTVEASEAVAGGGIYADHSVVITGAVIADNSALVRAVGATASPLQGAAEGGGLNIGQPNTVLTVRDTQIERNLAYAVVDAQESSPGTGGSGLCLAQGGGLYVDAFFADLSLERVRIANNAARCEVVAVDSAEALVTGGGAYFFTSPSITDSQIEDNEALGASTSGEEDATTEVRGGGAFFLGLDLTLEGVLIAGNRSRAATDAGLSDVLLSGGGLSAHGGVIAITDVDVRENVAQVIDGAAFEGLGGGLFVDNAIMTADALSVASNRAARGGGVALQDTSATITDANVRANGANNRGAGFYATGGQLSIAESIVTGNITRHDPELGSPSEPDRRGGGLWLYDGQLDVLNTEFSDNVCDFMAGGLGLLSAEARIDGSTIVRNSTLVEFDYLARGGGIWAGAGSLIVRGSSIADNVSYSGGGLMAEGVDLELDATTVSGNTAAGASGRGGGLYLSDAPGELLNSTLSANTATGFSARGAAIFNDSSEVNLIFCTVHANGLADGGEAALVHQGTGWFFTHLTLVGDNAPVSCNDGIVFSGGYNLDYDGSCDLEEAGDVNRPGPEPWDLQLTSLADNGGPTLTHAPLAGSPVIDRACFPLPFVLDQRGANRLADGDDNEEACYDIGAVEYQ